MFKVIFLKNIFSHESLQQKKKVLWLLFWLDLAGFFKIWPEYSLKKKEL
jgi:hypothetical protein